MSFLTTQQLLARVTVPVSMPATLLQAGEWLIISTFKLLDGQKAEFRFLQLHVASLTLPTGKTAPAAINENFKLVTVGLYKDYIITNDPRALSHVGSSDNLIQAAAVGLVPRDVSKPMLLVNEAGTYSFVACNNSDSAAVVTLTGHVTLTL